MALRLRWPGVDLGAICSRRIFQQHHHAGLSILQLRRLRRKQWYECPLVGNQALFRGTVRLNADMFGRVAPIHLIVAKERAGPRLLVQTRS